MIRYLKNQYQLGIKYWNRNQLIEAKYYLDQVIFDLYIDGKVVEICSIYKKSKMGNKIKSICGNGVSTVNERYQGNNEIPLSKFKGSCIIASSGMLNEGSRSSKYDRKLFTEKISQSHPITTVIGFFLFI